MISNNLFNDLSPSRLKLWIWWDYNIIFQIKNSKLVKFTQRNYFLFNLWYFKTCWNSTEIQHSIPLSLKTSLLMNGLLQLLRQTHSINKMIQHIRQISRIFEPSMIVLYVFLRTRRYFSFCIWSQSSDYKLSSTLNQRWKARDCSGTHGFFFSEFVNLRNEGFEPGGGKEVSFKMSRSNFVVFDVFVKSEETNFSEETGEKFENHDHWGWDCLLLESGDCVDVASNNLNSFRNLIFSNHINNCICHILGHPYASCPFSWNQRDYTIKHRFFLSLQIFWQYCMSSFIIVDPDLRLIKQ